MDATTALGQADHVMTAVIGRLTPDHRERATPCTEWNVHQVLEHACQGAHGIAGGLQGQAPPEQTPDYLADGPAQGWAEAHAALSAAATPEILAATHQMPFGEVPGEMALSVIVADVVTHAWDVAQGAGVEIDIPDELAEYALAVWQQLVPPEGRQGGFADVVPVPDDASAVERLAGYTGRQP